MLLLVDLDGVVYLGSRPVPGITAVLADRVAAGDSVAYCTNNSSRHRDEYLDRLVELGAPVSLETVFTSARATALTLAGESPRVRLAMVLGERGIARELRDVGIASVPPTARGVAAGPDAVVVGIDRRLTYARLAAAADVVRSGARFVATNRDPVIPTASGFEPGAGSIIAALETAGRRAPDLEIGKPRPTLFEQAARACGCTAEDSIVIGDGLWTDIAAARAFGARSILMLTGITRREDVDAVVPEARPTAVAANAGELRAAIERLATLAASRA
jgi:glycerol-1-phosphatase